MRWRRRAAQPDGAAKSIKAPDPPLPDNPYRRFFTPTPTFEDLVRRARKARGDSLPASADPDAGRRSP